MRPLRDPRSPSGTICKTDEDWRDVESSPGLWLTVLDLSVSRLESFAPSSYHLYPKHDFQNLRVLVLRSNLINDLVPLQLAELTNLTDLDLSFNKISGVVPRSAFPLSIERLDLSSNDITDLTYMSGYPFLLVMNVSNNCIREISVYPPNLTHLDVSENLISNVIDLRILALTPSIKILQISGNPVLTNSNQCKVTVCSVLPRLVMLDDLIIPSRNARLKNNAAHAQSIKDRNSLAANNKKIQEKADAVRSRSHALKLRAVEVERAVRNREIDEMANQVASAEKHRKVSDVVDAEESSGVHSNASRSKCSSNKRSSEGKGSTCSEKREPFAVFGLTRYPTYSRKESIKAYQTINVYSLPDGNNKRDSMKRDPMSTAVANMKKYKAAGTDLRLMMLLYTCCFFLQVM